MSDNTPTVKITHREKLYPEEEYEYEGVVNGKEWAAHQSLGHGSSILLDAPDGVELTDDEEQAVYDKIWSY